MGFDCIIPDHCLSFYFKCMDLYEPKAYLINVVGNDH